MAIGRQLQASGEIDGELNKLIDRACLFVMLDEQVSTAAVGSKPERDEVQPGCQSHRASCCLDN